MKTATAAQYIETVYGTRNFARAVELNDAESLMDMMNDFADYNAQQSVSRETADKMLEALKFVKRFSELNGTETKDELIQDFGSMGEVVTEAIQSYEAEMKGGNEG